MVSKRSTIILLAVFCLSTAALGGEVYRFEYQKIISVETGIELTLNNASGNVILTTNEDGKLKVDAVKRIYSDSPEEAEQVADHIQISVASAENHFTIEPKFMKIHDRSPSFWQKILGKSGETSYGSVDFVISVPVDCNADIYNTSGNIDIVGLRGRLLLSGTAGDIKVRDIQGDLEITTTSGNVVIVDIEGNIHINATGSDIAFSTINGNLDIRNSSGKTSGEYLVGDLTLSQTTGSIELARIEGDIRLKSNSGKIRVEQDFGALDVSTESGNIEIRTELNSDKDYFVESISGSIDFLIPGASSGRIKIEAGSGDIDTRIPIAIDSFSKTRISGSFGEGGPKITLATTSGDIRLAEY